MERKKEILEWAKKVIHERGYAKTRVSDIVLAAGVAQGTFYLYFPTKEALVIEMGKEIVADLKILLNNQPSIPDDIDKNGFVAELNRVFMSYMEFVSKNAMSIHILATEATNNDELMRMRDENVNSIKNLLINLLEKGKKMGYLKDFDFKSLANLVVTAILNFFSSDMTHQLDFPPEEVIGQFINICLYGILKV